MLYKLTFNFWLTSANFTTESTPQQKTKIPNTETLYVAVTTDIAVTIIPHHWKTHIVKEHTVMKIQWINLLVLGEYSKFRIE